MWKNIAKKRIQKYVQSDYIFQFMKYVPLPSRELLLVTSSIFSKP
jgi:hypothetical protein